MEDKQEQTIEKYGFQVKNRYRARGAVLLDTEDGPRLLREYDTVKGHFAFENQVKSRLVEHHMDLVDLVVPNQEGALVTEWESGEKYIVYKWFRGEECDCRTKQGLGMAAANLGRLHAALKDATEQPVAIEENLLLRFERHNREMRHVYGYMKDKKRKNEFELYALSCFHDFYKKAQETTRRLEKNAYFTRFGNMTRDVCHGEYNYHNLIVTREGIATTNFEHAAYGMQLQDLAYFLRKVMEKNAWNIDKGRIVIEQYDRENQLDEEAREFLCIALSYPVKYWKLLNQYMNRKKSWLSNKNIQKLIGVREQEAAKTKFLSIFS